MEPRHFLKLGFAIAVGVAALAASAQAAPLAPHPFAQDLGLRLASEDARHAVATEAEVELLKPERVHYWHHRGWRHCGCNLYGHYWYCPWWCRGY